jgi:hypothetical protein
MPRSLTTGRSLLWLALGLWPLGWLGPIYWQGLYPPADRVNDYFQDWGSARNYLEGRAIYAPQAETVPLYLGLPRNTSVPFNAHPPASVLVSLPFGLLPYRAGVLAWNLVSLACLAASVVLVVRGLGVAPRELIPLAAVVPFCHPLYSHLHQGQWTLPLLLLVTAAWSLDRSGRSVAAGAVLGLAASLKFFPAYLFLYFLMRRQWRPVAGGLASFAAANALALAVLGLPTFEAYVREIMPGLGVFRSYAYNLSLAGVWHKLFHPVGEGARIVPLWWSPTLANVGTLLSVLAATVPVALASMRAKTREARDAAFGFAVAGMLLASPMTWDFSLPLLLLPVALVARESAGSRRRLGLLVLALVVMWLPQEWWTERLDRPVGPAGPAVVLTAGSIKLYALLVVYALAWRTCRVSGEPRGLDLCRSGGDATIAGGVGGRPHPRKTTSPPDKSCTLAETSVGSGQGPVIG